MTRKQKKRPPVATQRDLFSIRDRKEEESNEETRQNEIVPETRSGGVIESSERPDGTSADDRRSDRKDRRCSDGTDQRRICPRGGFHLFAIDTLICEKCGRRSPFV